MVSSSATTVDEYVASLPADRRSAISAVRDVVNAHLPLGYEEGMLYGMPAWYVPLSRYPDTYNKQPLGIAGLASQKNYMALYLAVYLDPALEKWFKAEFAKAGKKLDMGKTCVRFTSIDALPLDVIGETIKKIPVDELVAKFEAVKNKPGGTRSMGNAKSKSKSAKSKSAAKSRAASKSKGKSKSKSAAKSKSKPAAKSKSKSKAKSKSSK